jgi:hypothetical protein
VRTLGSVVVHLVVKVETSAAWGDDCTLKQVRDQGTKEAINRVSAVLEERGIAVTTVEAREVIVREER